MRGSDWSLHHWNFPVPGGVVVPPVGRYLRVEARSPSWAQHHAAGTRDPSRAPPRVLTRPPPLPHQKPRARVESMRSPPSCRCALSRAAVVAPRHPPARMPAREAATAATSETRITRTHERPAPRTGPASHRTNTGYGKVCPQEDSNLRPCLRRAVLYPLSYGGQGARERGSRVAPATRPAAPSPRAGSADAFPLPRRLPAPAQARHARMDAGRPPRRPGTAAHPIPSRGDHL